VRNCGARVRRPPVGTSWPACASTAPARWSSFGTTAPRIGGEPIREWLKTPGLDVRLVALPAYSPDFNADEAIWQWIREEITATTCFGTAAKVVAAVGPFFEAGDNCVEEVRRRCRTVLQALAFPEPSCASHAALFVASSMQI
jgi:hypothetical protein